MRPVAVDLYCGAGGVAKGLQEAGFYVLGVDIEFQPNYCGDEFIQMDARQFLRSLLAGKMVVFDDLDDGANRQTQLAGYYLEDVAFIWASVPCQAHSDLQKQNKRDYPELIAPTRRLLVETGLPYVIENVEGAPLRNPIVLCGTMFSGLRVIRHRLFESNISLEAPEHHLPHPLVFTYDKRKPHYGELDQDTSFVMVNGGGNCTVVNALDAMGIDWPMTKAEVNEAIPPAYARFVGRQVFQYVEDQVKALV